MYISNDKTIYPLPKNTQSRIAAILDLNQTFLSSRFYLKLNNKLFSIFPALRSVIQHLCLQPSQPKQYDALAINKNFPLLCSYDKFLKGGRKFRTLCK